MTDGIGAFLQELGDAFREGWQQADQRAEHSRLWNSVRIRGSGWDQELADLKTRYDTLRNRHEASPFSDPALPEKLAMSCLREALDALADKFPPDPIIDGMAHATLEFLNDEIFFGFPHINWRVPLSFDEAMALKQYLDRKEQFLARPMQRVELWSRTLIAIWSGVLDFFPNTALAATDKQKLFALSASSVDLMHNPAEVIERLIVTLFDDDVSQAGLFAGTRERFEANVCAASGIPLDERATSKRPLVLPTGSELGTANLVEAYLSGTAFIPIFATDLPLEIPQRIRFEHCHILGGTGHGKTQLLQLLIRQDLDRVAAGDASVVIIDGQGDLIRTISHLDIFDPAINGGLADRLVLIDPNDIAYPAALNLFDVSRPRFENYSPVEREKLLNATIELYEYMFGELLGAELTQRQGVIFRYLARLMLAIPDATIQTLRELMEDGARFRPYMQALSGTARHFFDSEFFHPSFRATKQQILKRLWGVLSNPTFERMFSHPRNRLDLFELMNRGSVVLISTAKDLLKQEGSSIFGRFFIAQIMQAATERAIMPLAERTPTFVYIDEAADYLDHNIEHLVNQARKYGVGLTIAHQNLDQLTPAVRATVMASTSVKFAGGVSAKDARALAEDMRCQAETLQAMRKRRDRTEFAASLKNVTSQAVKVTVPLGLIESLPTLSDDRYQTVLAHNRERYCIPASEVDAHIERSRRAPISAAQPEKLPAEPSSNPVPERLPEAQPAASLPLTEAAPLRHSPPPPVEKTDAARQSDQGADAPPRPREKPARPPETPLLGQGGREHVYLQRLIKEAAQQNGWRAVIEQPVSGDATRVDVALERGGVRIACEISITTSVEHERGNVEKCLAAGYDRVYLVACSERRLNALRKAAAQDFSAQDLERLRFFLAEEIVTHLNEPDASPAPTETMSRGWKVKVSQGPPDMKQGKVRRDAVTGLIARSLKRLKGSSRASD